MRGQRDTQPRPRLRQKAIFPFLWPLRKKTGDFWKSSIAKWKNLLTYEEVSGRVCPTRKSVLCGKNALHTFRDNSSGIPSYELHNLHEIPRVHVFIGDFLENPKIEKAHFWFDHSRGWASCQPAVSEAVLFPVHCCTFLQKEAPSNFSSEESYGSPKTALDRQNHLLFTFCSRKKGGGLKTGELEIECGRTDGRERW